MTRHALTLSFALATLASTYGCDAVVGADCAAGLDPCGNVCCAAGYHCSEQMTCEPGAPNIDDAGLLGPWTRPQDAGEDDPDAGTVWQPDATAWPDATADATVDAEVDADVDPDASDDAGLADAEPTDVYLDPDAGYPDAEPTDVYLDPDAGYPDAAEDAGFPDAAEDAGFPDAAEDAGFPDADVDAGFADAAEDAGFPDADVDAGFADADVDAGPLDADVDAGFPDAGPICPLGTQLCDGQCFNTQTSTTHCGGCNNPCGAFEACNAGVCAPTCTTPRTQCPGGCVYVQSDPLNCGTCDNVCGSGVCYMGACVAPAAGHVVIIGHDMQATHPATLAIAGNALFLPPQASLRIGTFREATSIASEMALTSVMSAEATRLGRTYTAEIFSAAEVTQRLANVDVFVIFPQEGATDFDLITWGTDWSLALQTFVRRGGTVVLFDAGGAHAGTWQVLSAAGLFSASGRVALPPGELLDVVAPADALTRGAPLSYPAMQNTITFTSTSVDVVVETRSLPARPVVFHQVIVP